MTDKFESKREVAMKSYNIVLADDHSLFRQGLKKILELDGDYKVIGEACNGLELLDLLNKLKPHLIILDISMPKLRGIEAIPEIKKTHPEVKVLMLTMHKDKEYVYQAISAGADGYFLKKDADTQLFAAIEKVRLGKVYLPPALSEDLAGDWGQTLQAFRKPILTKRETEILKLVGEGRSNQEIANLLFISVHTAERHRANITEKLNLKGTAEIVKYAIHRGLVTEGE